MEEEENRGQWANKTKQASCSFHLWNIHFTTFTCTHMRHKSRSKLTMREREYIDGGEGLGR